MLAADGSRVTGEQDLRVAGGGRVDRCARVPTLVRHTSVGARPRIEADVPILVRKTVKNGSPTGFLRVPLPGCHSPVIYAEKQPLEDSRVTSSDF